MTQLFYLPDSMESRSPLVEISLPDSEARDLSRCDKFIFTKRWFLFGESSRDAQDPRFL